MDRHSLVVGTNICIWIYILWRLLLIISWFVVGWFFILLFTYNECIIFKLTCNYLPSVDTVTCLKYRCLIWYAWYVSLNILFHVRLTSKRLEIQKRLFGDSPYTQPMSHMEGLFPSTAEIFCKFFFFSSLLAYWQ